MANTKYGHWIFKERTKLVPTNKVRIKEGYHTVTDENIDKTTMILKKRVTIKRPYCSICGYFGDDESDATPYCPNCGKPMKNGR